MQALRPQEGPSGPMQCNEGSDMYVHILYRLDQSLGPYLCNHEVDHGTPLLLGDNSDSLLQGGLDVSRTLDSATPCTPCRDSDACIVRHFWSEAHTELSSRGFAAKPSGVHAEQGEPRRLGILFSTGLINQVGKTYSPPAVVQDDGQEWL